MGLRRPHLENVMKRNEHIPAIGEQPEICVIASARDELTVVDAQPVRKSNVHPPSLDETQRTHLLLSHEFTFRLSGDFPKGEDRAAYSRRLRGQPALSAHG